MSSSEGIAEVFLGQIRVDLERCEKAVSFAREWLGSWREMAQAEDRAGGAGHPERKSLAEEYTKSSNNIYYYLIEHSLFLIVARYRMDSPDFRSFAEEHPEIATRLHAMGEIAGDLPARGWPADGGWLRPQPVAVPGAVPGPLKWEQVKEWADRLDDATGGLRRALKVGQQDIWITASEAVELYRGITGKVMTVKSIISAISKAGTEGEFANRTSTSTGHKMDCEVGSFARWAWRSSRRN